MRLLILGAGGFIGRTAVREAAAADVSAPAETGFVLRHPSIREGLPATLGEVNR